MKHSIQIDSIQFFTQVLWIEATKGNHFLHSFFNLCFVTRNYTSSNFILFTKLNQMYRNRNQFKGKNSFNFTSSSICFLCFKKKFSQVFLFSNRTEESRARGVIPPAIKILLFFRIGEKWTRTLSAMLNASGFYKESDSLFPPVVFT